MPIYEYRCSKCADEFETIQKFSDAPLRTCSKCGGKLEKLLSRSGFSLKGAGWYADGYGGKSSGTSSGTSSGKSSKQSPSGSGSGSSSGGGSSSTSD